MTGVYLDPGGDLHLQVKVYADVRRPASQTVDCRTCQNAGMGTCNLYPGQCSSGSAYIAAPVLRFWRQS